MRGVGKMVDKVRATLAWGCRSVTPCNPSAWELKTEYSFCRLATLVRSVRDPVHTNMYTQTYTLEYMHMYMQIIVHLYGLGI